MNLQALGGRKFVFGMGILVMVFVLTIMKIDYTEFMKVALWAFGIFATTNAAQKLK
jgi:hypothetical protein